MPKVRPLTVTLVVLSFVSILFVSLAGAQRSAIDTYAITNARIVTVSGPTIERGTVVIRNGLIAAAGANVSAPSDARIIDGAGLTVYPGLIDSYTNLALPEAAPSPSPGGGGGGGGGFFAAQQRPTPGGPNSTQPPGLQPETMVEDVIRPGGNEIEASRSTGITTALISPRTGIWMGQSALINLAGGTPQEMIVRSPVAMHVGFTSLRGSYPGSLLGVFSTLRQMMLDAQRYRDSIALYERSPRGMRRPEMDRSLAALVPVVDGRMPVVMLANSEREISRALDLAAEFKLRLIIAGGRESDRVAARLVKQNVPVLLSLNLPRRTTAAIPEADPEPMRVLRDRVEAQQTAGKLAKAGVRFAFQSGSLTNISDLLANANRTIENGLSATDALRAFTISPATIFGVENQLGSVEAGKIANLTVTRGDLFDRNSRIAHVFIDGRPVDLRPAAGGPGGRNVLSGTWHLNISLGQAERAATLSLQQEGERLSGSISGSLGAGEISNASVTAAEVRFTVPLEIEGQTKEATFTGTLTGDQIRGTVTVVGLAPGSFSANRARPN
ncbi:MAG TPA: amidohydrolase family protein [Pyrinomonadaceae bacterium]|nr:amidohydrolase family protein [Pyrinomonadaceae bacterium]